MCGFDEPTSAQDDIALQEQTGISDYRALASYVSRGLSWAVLLAGVGAILATAYLVITTYSPLPHWDEWALFDHLATGGGWSLPWLWAQHNEHRILTTKIFFLLDVELFHGTQKFLLISIFLIQFLQAALLSWSVRVLAGVRGTLWRTCTGLIVYCVFCPIQYENLVWGFQVQFVLTSAMATLSILGLLLYRRENRTKFLTTCIIAATAATWSLANGMLLWPLLIGSALLLRMKRLAWAVLLAFSILNVGLYFFHYHQPARPAGPLSLRSIVEMASYLAVYLGSTWVRHSSNIVALIAGTAAACAALYVIVRIVVTSRRKRPLEFELAFLMLMVLLTAVITSLGRLHLGLEQATASRYQTFALILWCCLGLLLLLRTTASERLFQVTASVLLVLMLGFASQIRLPLIDAQWRQMRLKIISLALLTGVQDSPVLADAYPDPQVVLRDAAYMRQHRLSIFAGRQDEQLGRSVDSQYHVTNGSECLGAISSWQMLPADGGQGLHLTGYAWDRETRKPVADVVAVENGYIAGFGTSQVIPYFRTRPKPHADPARFGWLAFVGRPSSEIQLFAVTGKDQSSACPFASIKP
jgi:hypothetical protein